MAGHTALMGIEIGGAGMRLIVGHTASANNKNGLTRSPKCQSDHRFASSD
jgi:hypothetical protein